MSPLERMARALSRDLDGYGDCESVETQRVNHEWRKYVPHVRIALKALKYEDGTDESRLIDVSNKERIEAVSLALAWDAMIDAILAEPIDA